MTASKAISVKLEGTATARANLRVIAEKLPRQTRQAMVEQTDDVRIESQEECPYDYNNPHNDGSPHLRDTAKTGIDEDTDEYISTYVSYDTPYAVYQHEILEYNHLFPTKAKFLEDPANRHARTWIPDLLRKVQGVLENQTFIKLSADTEIARDYNAWQGAHYSALAGKDTSLIGHLGGRFI